MSSFGGRVESKEKEPGMLEWMEAITLSGRNVSDSLEDVTSKAYLAAKAGMLSYSQFKYFTCTLLYYYFKLLSDCGRLFWRGWSCQEKGPDRPSSVAWTILRVGLGLVLDFRCFQYLPYLTHSTLSSQCTCKVWISVSRSKVR